ncbi:Uncharacterized protein SCF082_LOCUS36524 [Durusdinium trenchii]
MKGLMGAAKGALLGGSNGPPPVGEAWWPPPDKPPLLPPPISPYFQGQPASRASAIATESGWFGAQADVANVKAQREYANAMFYADEAVTKAGEAAGYREAAVDWDKVNSMTQSLNELLRKSEALDGGDPPEVLMARHLHNQAKALVDEGETPLERFDYLEEKNQEAEQVFDGITLEELHKARDALHDQQDMAEEALKRADLHHDQMEKILHEWNSRSTVTKLPREMTKPNGDPWWPDPVPPPRLPDREIMLVPAGGGIKNFSPPGRYFL